MIDLSPLKSSLKGKPLAVLGLGRSGLSVFDACKNAGIDCVLWDDGEDMRKAAKDKGATIEDFTGGDFTRFAALCLAPGIPLTHPAPHPAVIAAKKDGLEVIGDMELFHRAKPEAKTIAITGTNGKSTTTALIGHILQHAGVECAVGGNIGEAVLGLSDLSASGIYVLELSSYQLDLMASFSPDISVLINISPDHLDRHGGMEGYIAAKERIFRGKGIGIIGVDDDGSAAIFARQRKEGTRRMTPVSCLRPMTQGVFVSAEGELFDGPHGVVDLNTCPALRGRHNWQNAALAYTACRAAGVDTRAIAKGLQNFPGLEHRQKIVTSLHGVTYVNDSKATNDDAAAMALSTYRPIYWIAGGKDKGGGYDKCSKYLSHVRHAFLIGAAEDVLAAWLDKYKKPYTRCGTLEKAVEAAHALAQKEALDHATVLLSPACSSFDQFKSFEQRGDVFCEAVRRVTAATKASPKKGGKA
ncbi:MAG: UDP-N-acetylmuramoyl-L-alanine--D-glutamate ligase [Alphaproteobacteria bacterium]|nr:UDP-N-acetylmuramoyl-L-alanine--D-glutamate ligase [Alphaproteobacteria bacterium]